MMHLTWARQLLDNREFVLVKGRHPSSEPNHGQDDAGYDSEEVILCFLGVPGGQLAPHRNRRNGNNGNRSNFPSDGPPRPWLFNSRFGVRLVDRFGLLDRFS